MARRQPEPVALSKPAVALLAAVIFLNYADRGTLATASPMLKDQLGLSNSQMGVLLSAFFWSYAPLQPLAGWVAQRFDVRHVLAGGLLLWSAATALTGLAGSFATLLALRVLLGIGESVTYPCTAKFLAQRAPEHQRGRANGLVSVGQALGPTLGTLLGGLVMARYGWRAGFLSFGAVSLLWLVPWWRITRDARVTAPPAAAAEPVGYLAIVAERAAWGAALGHFCSNYAYYFMLTWLPLYLVKVHGFTIVEMGAIGAGVYLAQAVSAALSGWAADRWILAGASVNRARKALLVAGMVGAAVAVFACAAAGPRLAIGVLLLAGVFFGMQGASLQAVSQTLAGPRAAAKWMGFQNLIANFAGVLAPLATGIVVDRTGQFYWAFASAAAVTLAGSLAFGVLIRTVAPVAWPRPRP